MKNYKFSALLLFLTGLSAIKAMEDEDYQRAIAASLEEQYLPTHHEQEEIEFQRALEESARLAEERQKEKEEPAHLTPTKSAIKYGEHHNIGKRYRMEDASVVQVPFFPNNPNSGLFAIFDGHNGDFVSKYAANNLFKVLITLQGSPERILHEGLLILNEKLRKEHPKEASEIGSCAIVALVNENKITVANIGDSRAVLSSNGKAVELSEDQKPSTPTEDKRIAKFLGWEDYGLERVFGKTNEYGSGTSIDVSRALGDFDFEESGLIHEPEIKSIIFNPSKDFLILASDGIFERDAITRQDAVDIVKASLEKNKNNPDAEKIAAQELVKAAYDKKSGDNLSVIVVAFSE